MLKVGNVVDVHQNCMIAEETLSLLSQLTGKPFAPPEIEGVFLHLSAQNAFAPPAMVGGLIEALQMHTQPHKAQELEPVFSDILARDRHTGYYIHAALRALYLDFALTRASLPGQEQRNFLVLGDYFNLSSVNDAIGRPATNDVMATICGIYLDTMTRAGVTDWLYHRSMGDEITFIVLNTDVEKVQKGLQDGEKITMEFIRALGLEHLRHKKYPDLTGAGLVTAMTLLDPKVDHRQIKQQLDDLITTRKKHRRKHGWSFFRRRGVEPNQFHNRSSEQRIDITLHKYRHYRTAVQFAAEAESKTSTRSALNPAKSLLVGRAIAWPRDDRIEYLRHHHDNSKIMLRGDIYNLGGLNAVFGHDGADHVKAHLIRILYNTIAAHDVAEPKIFDCGGGIIDCVINAMPDAQVLKLVQAIQNNIYYQILTLTVAQYANEYSLAHAGDGALPLGALPHPRHENLGTGLVLATHLVDTHYSLPEIIERVDKITNRTKMHDFAYLWHDDNNIVHGLALNESAEPVTIGPDRANAGSHYLPFTDALSQYLEAPALPSIFERPVGQICEILFGTDMQAVLGFKKAIRMLQEKQLPDETIESIQTYGEMDARLRAEGLPPLSVVSTQNRPAFAVDERPSFRTMHLAEKLENLPHNLTALILHTQAAFRTLKLIQPHGHLNAEDAVQVLREELAQALPQPDEAHPNLAGMDMAYRLARLFDRAFAILGRDLPDDVQKVLRDCSLEYLVELAQEFERADEAFLAKKLEQYARQHTSLASNPATRVFVMHAAVDPLIEKLYRKNLLDQLLLGELNKALLYYLQHIGRYNAVRSDALTAP